MDYRIGDVSRMLGISADLLRYYERKGVVHPRKGEKNGYRYYDARDIDLLLDSLWFKNYDFSMEEISHLLSDCDYETLSSELAAKVIDLEDQLQRRRLLLEKLRSHLEEMERARASLGKCDIVMSPETLYYINRRGSDYDDDPYRISLTHAWLKYVPFIRRCFEIRQEDLPGETNIAGTDGTGAGAAGTNDISWGLSLITEDTRLLPVFVHEAIEHLMPQNCVHSVFRDDGAGTFTAEDLRYITDFAAENGFRICGNAYGHLLFTVQEKGVQTGYFEVWIPVE